MKLAAKPAPLFQLSVGTSNQMEDHPQLLSTIPSNSCAIKKVRCIHTVANGGMQSVRSPNTSKAPHSFLS